jgi:HlyD family secretion protein
MSSVLLRLGALACAAAALTGSAASAQDREAEGHPGPRGVGVFNQVEFRTTILAGKPEGARVKKGEVVCELDPAVLKARLVSQRSLLQAAEADYQAAKLAREVAEIAVTEFVEGVFKQEWETVLGEIALAESERRRAEDRFEWSERMVQKGYVSLAENNDDKVSLHQKIFAFEQAQTRRSVLEKYTRDKTIKELRSEVGKMKAVELAKLAALEREQEVGKGLQRQIDLCKVVAPADGRVHFAPLVEPGAVVRDGQLLFRLVPDDAARTGGD